MSNTQDPDSQGSDGSTHDRGPVTSETRSTSQRVADNTAPTTLESESLLAPWRLRAAHRRRRDLGNDCSLHNRSACRQHAVTGRDLKPRTTYCMQEPRAQWQT